MEIERYQFIKFYRETFFVPPTRYRSVKNHRSIIVDSFENLLNSLIRYWTISSLRYEKKKISLISLYILIRIHSILFIIIIYSVINGRLFLVQFFFQLFIFYLYRTHGILVLHNYYNDCGGINSSVIIIIKL